MASGTMTHQPVTSIASPGGADCLRVRAGDGGDAERQVRNDRTDPADGAREMDGERELADAGS